MKLAETSLTVTVDTEASSQTIFGFGGAFTDAAGINLQNLSAQTRDALLRAYFDKKEGIRYTVGRVPIASCDFSTHEYSYLDTENDFNLTTFALAPEDSKYKIPFLLRAHDLTGDSLQLFASPWSAPGWMKTNGKMRGGGQLKGDFNGQYYYTYANYFRRFFEEYAKQNVSFWGVTIQNEPSSGLDANYNWQTLYSSNQMQRDFASGLLSSALQNSSASKSLKIMAWDDYRGGIFNGAKEIYAPGTNSSGPATNTSAIDGLATHWYDHAPFDVLSQAHDFRPDKFILASEACTGYDAYTKVILGDWTRGWQYGNDIMGNMRNWVVGWVDWNLCLDLEGGPNWVGNYVDSPIIVNATADEFYKQPMFYFLAHFSTFVPPGSKRIDSSHNSTSPISRAESVQHVAFETPDGKFVLVAINNSSNVAVDLTVNDIRANKSVALVLNPDSILTAIWQK